jgi:hypothetical protein
MIDPHLRVPWSPKDLGDAPGSRQLAAVGRLGAVLPLLIANEPVDPAKREHRGRLVPHRRRIAIVWMRRLV